MITKQTLLNTLDIYKDKLGKIYIKKKEVTQAQYDALSEEEKNNGTMYLITDASDLGEAKQIAYSNKNSGLDAINVQGAVDELNTKINNVGKVYKCTNLVAVTATQKTSNFGSLTLPAGTYMVTGSAKHATSGGICKIGIGTSDSSMPTSNGQDIYGNAGYDVNMGNVTRFINLTVETTLYFQTWAASDFEITPMEFSAIRIV